MNVKPNLNKMYYLLKFRLNVYRKKIRLVSNYSNITF